ncbi:hypothetical protein, partial [Rahnella bruchi]|uniref:hypothetical protein n=1 Tax=Rahnella bruchi TaxID=1510573 RepID=UPI0013C508CE
MRVSKAICLLQIGLQFSYSSMCIYAFSFDAAAEARAPVVSEKTANEKLPSASRQGGASDTTTASDTESNTSMAGLAAQSGAMLAGNSSSDALKGMVASGATGKAAQSVESWLNQFGTARV